MPSSMYGSDSTVEMYETSRRSIGGATYLDQQLYSDANFSNIVDNTYFPFSYGDDEQHGHSPTFENRKCEIFDITRSDEYPPTYSALPFQGSVVNSISSSVDDIFSPYNCPSLETIREVPPVLDQITSRESMYKVTEKEGGREEIDSTVVDTTNALRSSSVTIHLSDSDVNGVENSEQITAPVFSEQIHKQPSSQPPSPPATMTTTATSPSIPQHSVESRTVIPSIPQFHGNGNLLPGSPSSLSLSDPSTYQYHATSVNRMFSFTFIITFSSSWLLQIGDKISIQNFATGKEPPLPFSQMDSSPSTSSFPDHSGLSRNPRPTGRYPRSVQSMPSISPKPSAQTYPQPSSSLMNYSVSEESSGSLFSQPTKFSPSEFPSATSSSPPPPPPASLSTVSPHPALPHTISTGYPASNSYHRYDNYYDENLPMNATGFTDNRTTFNAVSTQQSSMYSSMASPSSSSLSFTSPYSYRQFPQRGNGDYVRDNGYQNYYYPSPHGYDQGYSAQMDNYPPMNYDPSYPARAVNVPLMSQGLPNQSFASPYYASPFIPSSHEEYGDYSSHMTPGNGNGNGNSMKYGMNSRGRGRDRERGRENMNGQQTSSNNVIDIQKVRNGEDNRTTLMIRNIPNRYVIGIQI